MNNFQIGEIAIFVNSASPRHLEECCIVEGLQAGRIVDDATLTWRAGEFYRVTFANDSIKYAAEPHQLRKRPGSEAPLRTKKESVGSWDDCVFKPNEELIDR